MGTSSLDPRVFLIQRHYDKKHIYFTGSLIFYKRLRLRWRQLAPLAAARTKFDKMTIEEDRGDPIRFIAGKYAGKHGWMDRSKEAGYLFPVIVDRGSKGLKRTSVQPRSIARESDYATPQSYAEAVISKCPDLEAKMVSLCRAFVKARIQRDIPGLARVFELKLKEAIEWQTARGSRASYRDIPFDG